MGKKNKHAEEIEDGIDNENEIISEPSKKKKRKKKKQKQNHEGEFQEPKNDSSERKPIDDDTSMLDLNGDVDNTSEKRKISDMDIDVVIKKKKKKKEKNDTLSLTYDLNDLFSLSGRRPQGSHLNFNDIRTLVMLTIHGSQFPCLPTWCVFNAWQKTLKTVIIMAGCISEEDYRKNESCFEYLNNNFPKPVPVRSDGSDCLVKSPLESILRYRMPKRLIQQKKMEQDIEKNSPTNVVDYVLTEIQLRNNDFTEWNSSSKEHGVVTTRKDDRHILPTTNSKLLAIDCEMCNTSTNRALTRISIVDGDLKTVYDKLVKPDEPITDYLTQFSGITAEMLANVTTKLEDVQKDLLELISPDTILVGHSLDFDLRSLKLHHDNVIDTSVLYTDPRGPRFKSALRFLVKTYLHRDIQTSDTGHCSIEDAKSCMELVLLKLKKGPSFGSPEMECESVYEALSRAGKRGALIDKGYIVRQYCHGNHHGIPCDDSDNKAVLNSQRIMSGVDFLFTHLRTYEDLQRGRNRFHGMNDVDEETKQDTLKKIDNFVSQIISTVPSSCLVIVSLSSGFISPDVMALTKDKEQKKSDKVKYAVRNARQGLCFMKIT